MEVCSRVHPEAVEDLEALEDPVDVVLAFLVVQQRQEAFLMALTQVEVNQWVVVPDPLRPLEEAWHC